MKPKTKQEAKRILSEKSIPYKRVKSAKDILIIGGSVQDKEEEEGFYPHKRTGHQITPKRVTADQLRFKH